MSLVSIADLPGMPSDHPEVFDQTENPLEPPGRWLGRQFIDCYCEHPAAHEARQFPSEMSVERCIELAHATGLHLDHLIELVGVGTGKHLPYVIDERGVAFRKWEEDYIEDAPLDWQVEMIRDNRTAPLQFPCTPAELLQFIDTAIGIHCFSVPDTFRQLVVDITHPNTAAPSGEPEEVESVASTMRHVLKTRRNILDAVITTAKKNAMDPDDAQNHWAALVELAASKTRPSPLMGFVEEEGVKYQDSNGVKFLSKRNFLRRIRTAKAG